MVVTLAESFAGSLDRERKRSFQSFNRLFGLLDRATVDSDLELIYFKA